MPHIGVNSGWGVGEESTFGTPVSRTHWFPGIAPLAMEARQAHVPRRGLLMAPGGVPRNSYRGRREVGGSLGTEPMFAGFAILWRAVLGGASASAWDTTPGTPNVHVLVPDDELPFFTIEQLRGEGRHGASDLSEVFSGCMVRRFTLRQRTYAEAETIFDWLGQDTQGRSSAGTPSWPAHDILEAVHLPSVSWNGNTLNWRSVELTIDTGIGFRDQGGSRVTARPVRINPMSIALRLELDHEDATLYNAHVNGTTGNASMTWTSGTQTVTFAFDNARVDAASSPIQGAGLVTESVTLIPEPALADSDPGVTLTLENAQASAETA